MSRENVALFIKAVNKDTDLNQQIAKTDKTKDWATIAKKAGFEFTADEFASVVSESLGRKTTADNAVREYLMAQQKTSPSETSQSVQDTVVGQRIRTIICNPLFARSKL